MTIFEEYQKLRRYKIFLESNVEDLNPQVLKAASDKIKNFESIYLQRKLQIQSPQASDPNSYYFNTIQFIDLTIKIIDKLKEILDREKLKVWYVSFYVKNLERPKYTFLLSGNSIPDLSKLSCVDAKLILEEWDEDIVIEAILRILLNGGYRVDSLDDTLIQFERPEFSDFVEIFDHKNEWFPLGGDKISFKLTSTIEFETHQDYKPTIIFDNTPVGTLKNLFDDDFFGLGTNVQPGLHILIARRQAVIKNAIILPDNNCQIEINTGNHNLSNYKLVYQKKHNNDLDQIIEEVNLKNKMIIQVGDEFDGGRLMLVSIPDNRIIFQTKFVKSEYSTKLDSLEQNFASVIHKITEKLDIPLTQALLSNYFIKYHHKSYLHDLTNAILQPFNTSEWKIRKNTVTNMVKAIEEILSDQSQKQSVISTHQSYPKARLYNYLQYFQQYNSNDYSQTINNIGTATGVDWLTRYRQIELKGKSSNLKYYWNKIALLANNLKHKSSIEYMLRDNDFWRETYNDFVEVLLDLDNIP